MWLLEDGGSTGSIQFDIRPRTTCIAAVMAAAIYILSSISYTQLNTDVYKRQVLHSLSMQRANIFFENHAPPCSMPPKLVYYVRVWGRNARPTQDMGMPPQENTLNYATIKYCDIANGAVSYTHLDVYKRQG